jgi:hypothetical protein
VISNFTARPTQGWCTFAFVHHIEDGRFDSVSLDGLNFCIIVHTPEEMGKGNWTVGVITDERASPEQQQAILGIVSGQAGGPMANLAGLVGTFAGVESRQVQFVKDGHRMAGSVPEMLDQALEAILGANGSEPMYVDNVPHPVNSRLALAHATRTHVHAFGIDLDNTSGTNNGHFAAFDWRG